MNEGKGDNKKCGHYRTIRHLDHGKKRQKILTKCNLANA